MIAEVVLRNWIELESHCKLARGHWRDDDVVNRKYT
jgi:hypothetical protein